MPKKNPNPKTPKTPKTQKQKKFGGMAPVSGNSAMRSGFGNPVVNDFLSGAGPLVNPIFSRSDPVNHPRIQLYTPEKDPHEPFPLLENLPVIDPSITQAEHGEPYLVSGKPKQLLVGGGKKKKTRKSKGKKRRTRRLTRRKK